MGTVVISGISGSRPASMTSGTSSIDHGRSTHPSPRGTGTSNSLATGGCSHHAQAGSFASDLLALPACMDIFSLRRCSAEVWLQLSGAIASVSHALAADSVPAPGGGELGPAGAGHLGDRGPPRFELLGRVRQRDHDRWHANGYFSRAPAGPVAPLPSGSAVNRRPPLRRALRPGCGPAPSRWSKRVPATHDGGSPFGAPGPAGIGLIGAVGGVVRATVIGDVGRCGGDTDQVHRARG